MYMVMSRVLTTDNSVHRAMSQRAFEEKENPMHQQCAAEPDNSGSSSYFLCKISDYHISFIYCVRPNFSVLEGM
ncbi:hypothetical protein CAEBREN_29438 [Caenorhabditis brenneri]|uniref:Uncharacterized protein n=1 Tax=Caenorhabditis brenneri TaxID=135651 RepID=G0M8A9_CAEBE|nr:hypothetical protein CAEBREN_29438 [Caenorhabditis brenneri]